MKQLTQKLSSGDMCVQEVPLPSVSSGTMLVRNHFSLISAGTEASTVKTARKSLLGKAKERPAQVRQVLEVLKRQGPVQTFRAVMKKLDAYSPLGYSSSGEVIEIASDVTEFQVGDHVACAGAGYANHAEVVAVPVNLCVKLPQGADLKAASYNTVGAIALQGIRQADLRLGETCAVIGLGLIGQLTCLMLRASGVRVFGIDVDAAAVQSARQHCCDAAWLRTEPGAAEELFRLSDGLGADAVIITAASSSDDPINFAGELARKKGRVIVVGAVPTGFERDTYYKKELDLRMSCSYGPGRYDLAYEEKGIDYPPAYVRWTEKRNMQAFQHLLHSKRIDVDYLTTHCVALDDAPKAYEMILTRSEPFLGIVLSYDVAKPLVRQPVAIRATCPGGGVGIGFIGAGSYAQGNLLPHISRNDPQVVCRGVMTNSGTTSKRVAERFGFEFCTSDADDLLGSESVNTVFIATRHDSHAQYVLRALRAGKHVFVEKPLCLTAGELREIKNVHSAHAAQQLMVGFNRRFAPHAVALKRRLGDAPMSMLYRINAGAIPKDSWIQDPTLGGGRILGEVCHFVDFLTFLCGAMPVSVFAAALPDPQGLNDTVNVSLTFADGSIGTISYMANGSKELPKEYVEVYQAGMTAVLRDFKHLEIYARGKPAKQRLLSQDKGQAAMVRALLDRIKQGGDPLIPPEDVFTVTRATLAAVDSLRSGGVVRI